MPVNAGDCRKVLYVMKVYYLIGLPAFAGNYQRLPKVTWRCSIHEMYGTPNGCWNLLENASDCRKVLYVVMNVYYLIGLPEFPGNYRRLPDVTGKYSIH